MFFSPWKPLRLSFNLDQQVEQLFNELIYQPWGHGADRGWQPAIDVVETDAAYLLEADLPGVRPEDIDLRVQDNVLRIRGRRDVVQVNRTARSVSVERAHGEFSREFKLSHPVNAAAIKVHFDNGILRAILPKVSQEELPAIESGN